MKDRREYHRAWHLKNKEKQRRLNTEWSRNNPEKVKSIGLKHRFGITLEDYKNLYMKQKGLCAICGDSMQEAGRYTHIDHCHITKKVRGILCRHCNLGLGCFRDTPQFLTNAITYLRKYG